MVRVFDSISKVKGLNLMSGVVCDLQWYVNKIFFYLIPIIGVYVDYVAYPT
jgi:hypothetical protein